MESGDLMYDEKLYIAIAPLERETRHHLLNVYTCLTFGMLCASGGSFLYLRYGFQGGVLTSAAAISLLMAIAATPHQQDTKTKRLGLLVALWFFTGLSIGPTLEHTIEVNPKLVVSSFLFASVVFVSFSLSALYFRQEFYLYSGGIILSALTILSFVTHFKTFSMFQLISLKSLYVGMLCMWSFIVYDTRLILQKFKYGDDDYVCINSNFKKQIRHSFTNQLDDVTVRMSVFGAGIVSVYASISSTYFEV